MEPNLLSSVLKTNAESIPMSSTIFLFDRSSNLMPRKCSNLVRKSKGGVEEPSAGISFTVSTLRSSRLLSSLIPPTVIEMNSPSTSSTLASDYSVFMGNLHLGPLAPTFLAKSRTQTELSHLESNRA